jgi:hypothetical protein
VWLRGARIDGRLDLDQVDAVCPLVLEHCRLDAGISAIGAHLPALTLVGCRLEHPTQPALAARGVHVDGSVLLTGSTLLAEAEAGAVDLVGARIGGDLDCRAAVLGNGVGSAFAADRAQVENNGCSRTAWTPRAPVSGARCGSPAHGLVVALGCAMRHCGTAADLPCRA